MIEQIVTSSMEAMAKQLRKYSGRGRLVLIGPVRIRTEPKSGRDMYGCVAICHDKTGHEWMFETMVFFGGVAGEPSPEVIAAVDTVLLVKRADEVTLSEADKRRDDLIGLCRRYFKRVRTFETERALADAMVEFFPGEKSQRMRAAVRADPNSI